MWIATPLANGETRNVATPLQGEAAGGHSISVTSVRAGNSGRAAPGASTVPSFLRAAKRCGLDVIAARIDLNLKSDGFHGSRSESCAGQKRTSPSNAMKNGDMKTEKICLDCSVCSIYAKCTVSCDCCRRKYLTYEARDCSLTGYQEKKINTNVNLKRLTSNSEEDSPQNKSEIFYYLRSDHMRNDSVEYFIAKQLQVHDKQCEGNLLGPNTRPRYSSSIMRRIITALTCFALLGWSRQTSSLATQGLPFHHADPASSTSLQVLRLSFISKMIQSQYLKVAEKFVSFLPVTNSFS